MTIRVMLVDDHALIRRGLRDALQEFDDIRVVAEAASYGEWRQRSHETVCDVLVVDVNMPGRGGLEILKALRDTPNAPRALVLSQYGEDQYGVRALEAGAMGYLNKGADPERIVAAVRDVASGRKVITPLVAEALADRIAAPDRAEAHEGLSGREMQVCMGIAKGSKPARMAEELSLSPKTISVYRTRVMTKLGLKSNAEVAAYALRKGLID